MAEAQNEMNLLRAALRMGESHALLLAWRADLWNVPRMPIVAALKEYDAPVDAKKRVTIRGATTGSFRVVHRKDGTILLKPRELQDGPAVSAKALRRMDEAMKNLRAGKRSKPADLKKYASFAK